VTQPDSSQFSFTHRRSILTASYLAVTDLPLQTRLQMQLWNCKSKIKKIARL